MPTSQEPGAERTADAHDLSVLDTLPERPLHEHVAIYDALHGQLQRALTQIDEA